VYTAIGLGRSSDLWCCGVSTVSCHWTGSCSDWKTTTLVHTTRAPLWRSAILPLIGLLFTGMRCKPAILRFWLCYLLNYWSPIFQVDLHCVLHRVATSSCRGHVDELATEPFLLLHREHRTGYRRSWNCCDRRTCFVVIWKHFCFILSMGTKIRIDSVMRPRSSGRGRNTSASVTVTVTVCAVSPGHDTSS